MTGLLYLPNVTPAESALLRKKGEIIRILPAMLILASASPARQELLREAGFRFRVLPAHVPELKGRGRTLGETVLENARRKARPVARRNTGEWVLAADTMIEFEGRIYGKPGDRKEGVELLYRMGGKEHRLATGVVLRRGKRILERVVESRVMIRPLDRKTLRKHVTRPQRFAGGYSVREKNDPVVEKVEGSWTNVVGLPMEVVAPLLVRLLA